MNTSLLRVFVLCSNLCILNFLIYTSLFTLWQFPSSSKTHLFLLGDANYFFIFLFFLFFWQPLWHVMAPGSGSEPAPQQRPEPPPWPCQILNPLSHKRTAKPFAVNVVFLVRKLLQWGGLLASTLCPLALSGSPGIPTQRTYIHSAHFPLVFSPLGSVSPVIWTILWVPRSFLPQVGISSKIRASHMRSDFLLGFLEMLLLWWRPSWAKASGLASHPSPHLSVFFSWTTHLSFLICKMGREHVLSIVFAPTLGATFKSIFAALASYSLMMPSSICTSYL